ncbi:uncharacterized protein FFNC_11092 [Fusarium fujikuroi]|nr:uncharacterized protein FFE2_11046 [Fusarium fujikuroi]SCO47008.1 uncharacterized protein FFNC_11092 [Fusarium fujikuroi]
MDESHLTPVQTLSCTNDQHDYLFHHLILPSKLPGHDAALASNEEFLINFVIQSLTRFGELSDEADDLVTNRCIAMLKNTRDARDSNVYLDSRSVQNSFKRLSEQVDAASMYHITEQNAGLIIRRLESSYSLETFELSPTKRAAMATKGRLIREFPATTTEVSDKDFNDSSFQEVFAKTLVKMSHQAVEEIPRDIITFLNLFAGQLYLSSYDDYKLVCDLLCLAWDSPDDGAVGGSGSQCGFTKSPAMFLKEVLEKVRQGCGTIEKTDMGRVIEGVRLGECDFENRHAT